jgi:hypothetical protein
MSMMGKFREIPSPLLARLKADPSLGEEIVGGASGVSPSPFRDPEGFAQAMEEQIQKLAGNKEQILKLLPPSQRKMITMLPPDHQERFFKEFAVLPTKAPDSTSPPKSPAPEVKKTLADQDLGPLLEVEKAWHGLHYLLAGNANEVTPGAGQAVFGGREVGPDRGYGPARLLNAEEVATVSTALSMLKPAALRARFKPAAMDKAEIYPGGWGEEPGNLKWLLDAFKELKKFYAGAAARGSGVLVYIT